MKPKKVITKEDQIAYWLECYFQAKTMGDKVRAKMFEAVLFKLGAKIPRL